SGEVAALAAPSAQRLDHPVDQLADARLPVRRALLAAEVLLGDDVDRQLRPGARDLDVALLEDDLALLADDRRGPPLPLDQVVGARRGEVATEAEPPTRGPRGGVAATGLCCDVGYVLGHLADPNSLQLGANRDGRGPGACPPHMPQGLDL